MTATVVPFPPRAVRVINLGPDEVPNDVFLRELVRRLGLDADVLIRGPQDTAPPAPGDVRVGDRVQVKSRGNADGTVIGRTAGLDGRTIDATVQIDGGRGNALVPLDDLITA